jgi:hypothetical protein
LPELVRVFDVFRKPSTHRAQVMRGYLANANGENFDAAAFADEVNTVFHHPNLRVRFRFAAWHFLIVNVDRFLQHLAGAEWVAFPVSHRRQFGSAGTAASVVCAEFHFPNLELRGLPEPFDPPAHAVDVPFGRVGHADTHQIRITAHNRSVGMLGKIAAHAGDGVHQIAAIRIFECAALAQFQMRFVGVHPNNLRVLRSDPRDRLLHVRIGGGFAPLVIGEGAQPQIIGISSDRSAADADRPIARTGNVMVIGVAAGNSGGIGRMAARRADASGEIDRYHPNL